MISTRPFSALTVLSTIIWLGGCADTSGGSSSTPSAVAGTVVLETASSSAASGTSAVKISVNRTGGSSGAVTVAYTTVNGSAVSGSDYTFTSGKLDWASGDTAAKTIVVLLKSPGKVKGVKSFTVSLSLPTGGATLGAPSNATVSIDGTSAATTPTDTSAPMGQAAAARLLSQGTMGATISSLNSTALHSYDSWFAAQTAAAPSLVVPKYTAGDWSLYWWDNAIYGDDQLRQRMAFALSEILVISQNGGPLWVHNAALATYYDLLVNNAFGNYRTLLDKVTLSAAMGQFLSMMRNNKPNVTTGVHADQNYAREVMQLFTVGLVKLNIDGSVMVGSDGQPLPTYVQADVENLANVFTGWSVPDPNGGTSENSWLYIKNDTDPMVAFETHHDTDAKTIIGGVTIPAGGTAAADLKLALDTLFNHPNMGPFLSRQLIQRLVTSNPSPAYIQRVATVFNNDGTGVRGNLLAVAKAILTDPEATQPGGATYGKVREPLLRMTNLWRAFDAANGQGHAVESTVEFSGTTIMGEYPLYSPTVFNFFVPDFQPSGALAAASLVAPEIQITNESTLVTTGNTLQWQTYQYVDSAGQVHKGPDYDLSHDVAAHNTLLHTAQWEPLAKNPAGLVDQLNLVFMAGQMPASMRSSLISYLNSAAASTPAVPAALLVVEATDLVVNSPQSAVQR